MAIHRKAAAISLGITSCALILFLYLNHWFETSEAEKKIKELTTIVKNMNGEMNCQRQFFGGPVTGRWGGEVHTLCWISFEDDPLTDDQLASLEPYLKGVRVELLNLKGTRISDLSVNVIGSISPKIVYTADTAVTSAGLSNLRSLLPESDVVHD